MIVLGLDIATRCGWALVEAERPTTFKLGTVPCRRIASGWWQLDEGGEPEVGARMLRLWKRLDELRTEFAALDSMRIDLVAREGVGHYKGDHTTLVCVGLIAHAESWAYRRGLPIKAVPITDVKVAASGRGKASKAETIRAAARMFQPHRPANDDEAEALLVAAVAIDRALRI